MTTTPTDDLPPLPEPDMWIPHSITELSASYTADQMRAYALADRQARAAQADQCAEVAAALEIRAILEQIKEVAALHPADDMPTPFQSAWQLCCEEIFYRATGQQWHMDEDDGRRNVSGETAGQKIVRAAAQQPAAVVLNPATGDVRFEPEQQSTAQPVALWQFRWLNMDNEQNPAPSLLEWTEVKPWNPNLQTLEQRIEELRAFRYKGKPAYEVRALYAAPPRTDAPALTEALRRLWPAIQKAMDGLVFTADKAGEVQADMAAIDRALRTASKPSEPAQDEALKADAARYRVVRGDGADANNAPLRDYCFDADGSLLYGHDLDAACDAALAQIDALEKPQ